MSAAIDGIGLVSGVLGIISFLTNHLPHKEPQGTTVFVKSGAYNTLHNGGGKVDTVFGFDNQNGYIGEGHGTKTTNQGGGDKITIDQRTPNKQADFVDVTFTNDAVCVAWISVRMHDGSPGGGWTGDIGKECGQIWYKNNQAAGHKKHGKIYRPHCTWFDGDHTNGIKSGGVKFRTRAYGSQSKHTLKKGHACKSSIFSHNNNVINKKPAKRQLLDERPEWVKELIVVSENPDDEGAAEELCNSDTSWGFDFLSHGMFCDMGTKQLHPSCDVKDVSGCVDFDQGNNTLSVRKLVEAVEKLVPFKQYTATDLWTVENMMATEAG